MLSRFVCVCVSVCGGVGGRGGWSGVDAGCTADNYSMVIWLSTISQLGDIQPPHQ